MTLKHKTIFSLTALPLLVAGCAGTNPQAAINDVHQTVTGRLGQSVTWRNTNDVAQTVAMLLQTNLTPQSAVTIALLQNKSLQAGFEQIGISQADLAQASRLHNLQLFGSWRVPNQPPSIADSEYSAAGDFLDLLTLPARKKIAERNLEQSKLEVADQVLQLAADAQTAYYDLQGQLELTNRLGVIVAVDDAAADFAQRLHDAGNINQLELHTQQAAAAQAELDLMRAQAAAQGERERLNRLLGLSGGQIHWRIADALPALPATEAPLARLESLAVTQRLDLAAERSQTEALAAALRLKSKTRFLPGVTVGVDTEISPDGQRVTGPTLGLELPLFDQGQPAVARLTAEYRQAQDNYDALAVNVCSEVRQAEDALLAARAAAEFCSEHLLPLQADILAETLRQYNAMQSSTYELLLAKEHETSAVREYVRSLRDYWIARAELERAVGGRLATAPPVKSN